MAYFTYILASKPRGTLYVGRTNNLVRRLWEHKEELQSGFTEKYGVHRLVWYEEHATAENAIRREKRLKHWNRAWKVDLIEKANLNWSDLWDEIATF
ncbi:MAG: endonuclease [Robiginitomaculum sp.]|nr:MAG: endonuclease [Robiginitomaculum sp.]